MEVAAAGSGGVLKMERKNSKYIFFYLEVALRKKNDLNIYAFINVSNIPTKKLIEIFKINLKKDPYILDGYFLTKTSYRKYKKYFDKEIGSVNLDVFEYCLRQYSGRDKKSIIKPHKRSLTE